MFSLRHLQCHPDDKYECCFCKKFFHTGSLYQHQKIFCPKNPKADKTRRAKIKESNKERCKRYAAKNNTKNAKQLKYAESQFEGQKERLLCKIYEELPVEHFLFWSDKHKVSVDGLSPVKFGYRARVMYFVCFKKFFNDVIAEIAEMADQEKKFSNKMSNLLLKKLSVDKFNQFDNNNSLQIEIFKAALSTQDKALVSNTCCLNRFIYCISFFYFFLFILSS